MFALYTAFVIFWIVHMIQFFRCNFNRKNPYNSTDLIIIIEMVITIVSFFGMFLTSFAILLIRYINT